MIRTWLFQTCKLVVTDIFIVESCANVLDRQLVTVNFIIVITVIIIFVIIIIDIIIIIITIL